jgi:hypothetical protein
MNITLKLNICTRCLIFINLISMVSLFQKVRYISLWSINLLIIFSNREMKALKEYWNMIRLYLLLRVNISLKVKELIYSRCLASLIFSKFFISA